MKQFHCKADFIFQAEGIGDAFRKLAAYFTDLSLIAGGDNIETAELILHGSIGVHPLDDCLTKDCAEREMQDI